MKNLSIMTIIAAALILSAEAQKAYTKAGKHKIAGLSLMELSFAAQDNVKIKLKKRQTFEGYYKGYFSPDSTRLALLYKDHVDLVDINTGRNLFRLQIPGSRFDNVTFSPDGRMFATNYVENSGKSNSLAKITLWDTITGREVRTLVSGAPGQRGVYNLSFSRDSHLLASHADGVGRIWEVSTGREIRQFLPPSDPPGLEAVASLLSPDSKWFVVNFRRFIPPLFYDVVKVWELETGRETVLETNAHYDWRFSPDSTMLAITAQIDGPIPTERPVVAQIWEVGSWTRKRVIEVPDSWQAALNLAFSADSEVLAIGGNKMFGLFSVATGELLAEKRHTIGEFESILYYDVTWIEFSPDGKTLLTAGEDGYVRLWKIKKKS
jgi:WD40 repeat protein